MFNKELDILVNAAGLLFEGDLLSTYPEDFDYLMAVNLKAVFYICSLLNGFLSKTKGLIINISCQVCMIPIMSFISMAAFRSPAYFPTACLRRE